MATPILQWLRALLRILSSSKAFRCSVQRIARLWSIVQRHLTVGRWKRRPPSGGDGSSQQCPEVSESKLGRVNPAIIYTSKEPASYPALSPEQARGRNSEDNDSISISMIPDTPHDTQRSRNSHHSRHNVCGEHLTLPSRPSSRGSVRPHEDRLSRIITAADSRRPLSRPSSRASLRTVAQRAVNSRTSLNSVRSGGSRAQSFVLDNSIISAPVDVQNLAAPSSHTPFDACQGRVVSSALSQTSTAYQPLRTRTQTTYPILETRRYERGAKLKLGECMSEYFVEPLQVEYPLENSPKGWEAHIHPEGALYFFDRTRKIYTEAWLCDTEILDEVEDFAAVMSLRVHEENHELPPDTELVLELEEVGDNAETDSNGDPVQHLWTYYYVNHNKKALFWLDEYDVINDLEPLKGLHSITHIKHGIEKHYWKHWEYFPIGREIPKGLRKEVLNILVHQNVDRITSKSSTVDFTVDELRQLTSVFTMSQDPEDNEFMAFALGRMMCMFAHHRYHFYHGQKVARLDMSQGLFDTPGERTAFITSLSQLLFNAPEVQLQALEEIYVDGVINEIPWTKYIQKLQTDWQESVFTATILLNANISFMTISDVDNGTSSTRTPAQIASFVSTISSFAAVLIGMLLIRQHRVKPKETAKDAVTYLIGRKHPTLGLETLAIMYSLPYALLMWSVVTFLVGFAFECFRLHDNRAIIVTAVTWGLAAMLLVMCLYTVWEGGSFSIHGWVHGKWAETREKMRVVADGLHSRKPLSGAGALNNTAVPAGGPDVEMLSVRSPTPTA